MKPVLVLDPLDKRNEHVKWRSEDGPAFDDGAFHLFTSRSPSAYQFENGLAQIEAEHVSGSMTAGYGMSFRYTQRGDRGRASGYWLLITANGRWQLVRQEGYQTTALTQWAASAAIRTDRGARNTLAVRCRGGTMTVLINGSTVGEVMDTTYLDAGGVGPVSTSDELHIAFRNLKIDPDA